MNKTKKTALDVLRQLERELGAKEGLKMFEWYCENYGIYVGMEETGHEIPSTVLYEVFGE